MFNMLLSNLLHLFTQAPRRRQILNRLLLHVRQRSTSVYVHHAVKTNTDNHQFTTNSKSMLLLRAFVNLHWNCRNKSQEISPQCSANLMTISYTVTLQNGIKARSWGRWTQSLTLFYNTIIPHCHNVLQSSEYHLSVSSMWVEFGVDESPCIVIDLKIGHKQLEYQRMSGWHPAGNKTEQAW